jgi:hypothetical protein
MADEQQPRDSQEGLSREDDIVGRLVPDPSQSPPPTVVLTGLLGRSAKEGYWRLYFSSTLERYAEVKEEDVLHSEKIPQERSPFAGIGATRVWIKRSAQIEYTRTESRRMQAEFLSGRLAAGFARVGGGLAFRAVPCDITPTCPPKPHTWSGCRLSWNLPCTPACPTPVPYDPPVVSVVYSDPACGGSGDLESFVICGPLEVLV